MPYEPVYERFETVRQDGNRVSVEFLKSGFLAAGDQPELYFFRVGDEDAIVGISGEGLVVFQRKHRYLSREEKIDIAGLFLKRRIEAGLPLTSQHLGIREPELEQFARQLALAL